MNNERLIESLEKHRLAIQDETISKLDFDQMENDLKEAAAALNLLGKKEKLYDQLVDDFKSEIKRMALALSRAKGNLSSTGLVEKLLSSPDISYDDLKFLRDKVREEFNQSFPASPHYKVVADQAEPNFKMGEFKTGVGANL
ncbi:MAG: hypothetical protein ABII96_05210 [Candidatus Zixiibacteriota bacterium]